MNLLIRQQNRGPANSGCNMLPAPRPLRWIALEDCAGLRAGGMRVAIKGAGITGPAGADWLQCSGHEQVMVEKTPPAAPLAPEFLKRD